MTNHLVGEGQGFHLIVGDIDQGQFQLFVDFLELAPQVPFQVGIDDGQRFIEKNAATSLRTRPRPRDIFCLASAPGPRLFY
jgi:hypothetical protein